MSLAVAGLWIATFWLVVYAVKYSRRSKLLLPSSHHRRPACEVTVTRLNVRFKTEAFNTLHDALSTWLSANKSPILRQVLLRFYDLGSFLGVIGTLLGFSLLFLSLASLSLEILHPEQASTLSPGIVMKRGLDTTPNVALTPDALRINPIIPGFTVPLGDLPLILVALTVSQIVHEAGHAITAAVHRIPMLSCGVAVAFLFPSAFVTLPAVRLEKLPPRDRLQIVSAGCFHNFVLWCLLIFAAWSGISSLPIRIFFEDISASARLVVSADYDSPLATHLPVGTLITKIDDFPMASVSSDNPWDYYLLSPSLSSSRGWCADRALLDKALISACTSNSSYSCFVSKEDEMIQYELDPIHIFTDNLARCGSIAECSSPSSCVVPRDDQQLVRISVLRNPWTASVEDIVIWKGPKEEIWEQIQVDKLRPRIPLVSSKLPKFASVFFEYMKTANLSLYLLNMLPILALDGYQSLGILLQLIGGRTSDNLESMDLEALGNTARPSRESGLPGACRSFLSFLTLLLVALCGILGTINWAKK